MQQSWRIWWQEIIIKIQNQETLTEEEVQKSWNFLWNEWKKIEKSYLSFKVLPPKLKMVMALRKIDPMVMFIAPTFLTGIFAKGIKPEEMVGFINSFKDNHWFDGFNDKKIDDNLIYTNGFGGDQVKTINVSTPAMLIAGAANAKILKMGSHSYFGTSGAENFTDSIGYNSFVEPDTTAQAFKKTNVVFIDGESAADKKTKEIAEFMSLAPDGKEIMKALFYPFRYQILCFNFFQAPLQQRGISTSNTEMVAEFLTVTMQQNIRKGMVVAGTDTQGRSLDEVSNVGKTKITFVKDNKVAETIYTSPGDWGVIERKPEEIRGGSSEENLKIILEVFKGKRDDAFADLLAINASQFLYLNGSAKDFKEGTMLAKQAIASGQALNELERFVNSSNGKIDKLKRELDLIK